MFYNSLRRLWGWGRIAFSVLFAATIALIARAQSPPDAAHQSAPIVRSIDVQYNGPATISRARVLAQMRTKIGLPYSDTVAEDDIRTLYNTGQFQNVRIFGQPEGDGVKVIVAVQTRTMLNEIQIDGATRISPKRLRKKLGVKLNTPLREEDLEKGRQKIVETYQAHGFTDVDVTVRDVRKERTSGGALQIVIVVDEGPLYHVGKISFVGYKATNEQKLRALLKMKEGDVYSAKAIKDDAKALADAYGSGGYVDLTIIPESSPAHGGLIDLTYRIEEGQRSYVERINIIGNTRTKDKVIRREVLIAPGDVFNTVRVETSKKRLENLGYFSKVETFPVDTGVEGRQNLDIQVEEKRTGSLNFGAGFSTVDSLIGFIELTQVNFDITNWPSLTGGGQKLRIRLQGGLERKDAEVALTEPWFMDRPIAVSFGGFYHEANYLSSLYDQRNYGFSLDVRKGILPYLYATLGYRLENIDAFDIAASASPQLVAETGDSTKSVVTASLVFDRRDNPFLTRHGERITYTWWVAGPGGTEQIYGFDVEASKYWHLPWDTILLVNAEVAGVDSWGDQTKLVKIYDRLFLGGSNNLRGFEFRDVGPKDELGEPLGGQSMARVTVEYTFPIIEKARGAIFYDTGFVNTNPWDYNFNNVASDIGFGLRLDLPIGPLRLDYGIPIQQAGNHGSGKFNFNVGYQF